MVPVNWKSLVSSKLCDTACCDTNWEMIASAWNAQSLTVTTPTQEECGPARMLECVSYHTPRLRATVHHSACIIVAIQCPASAAHVPRPCAARFRLEGSLRLYAHKCGGRDFDQFRPLAQCCQVLPEFGHVNFELNPCPSNLTNHGWMRAHCGQSSPPIWPELPTLGRMCPESYPIWPEMGRT